MSRPPWTASKEDTRVAYKYMMVSQTTEKCKANPQWASSHSSKSNHFQNHKRQVLVKMWREGTLSTAHGSSNHRAIMENSMDSPKEIKNWSAIEPSSARGIANNTSRDLCTPAFIAALFTIAGICALVWMLNLMTSVAGSRKRQGLGWCDEMDQCSSKRGLKELPCPFHPLRT